MRLKVFTTAALLFGVVLLIAWPFILGDQPAKTAPEPDRLRYFLRFGLYFLALIITFFTAALGAFFVARRAREQFREEAVGNLHDLIESSLEDHADNGPA